MPSTTVLPASGADPTRRLATTPAPPAVPPPPPTVSRPMSPLPQRRSGSSVALWLLVVVALVALGLLVWKLVGEGGGSPTPSSTPSASSGTPTPDTTTPATTPTTTAPTPSDTPTPTPTADPGADVTAAYGALQDAVAQAQSGGQVDKKFAKTVDEQARATDKALRSGDAGAVVDAAQKLSDEYQKAVQDGTVSPDATGTLDPLVQDVVDAANAYSPGLRPRRAGPGDAEGPGPVTGSGPS